MAKIEILFTHFEPDFRGATERVPQDLVLNLTSAGRSGSVILDQVVGQ
jgi:hypothetical protein